MSYYHIDNLYKSQDILMLRECYAMEKVHGTSAHIRWQDYLHHQPGVLTLFSGGASHEDFVALFDRDELEERICSLDLGYVTIYGEAYGGKMQGMSDTYGPSLRFIVFEVRVGRCWLNVPDAESIAGNLGLEFVPYRRIPADIRDIDAELARPSEVAIRRGCGDDKMREGVVLRPIVELHKSNNARIIAKHKNDAFRETRSKRRVEDTSRLKVLEEANAIAEEWVTEARLSHVLDGFVGRVDKEHIGEVIKAMIADVEREAKGEIVESKDARKAIGKRTAQMFKRRLQSRLYNIEGVSDA